MSPDAFRLLLAICFVSITVAIMGAVNPVALFFAFCGVFLWLCYRVIRWAWGKWGS